MNKGWYKGSVHNPSGAKGWLIGAFLDKDHPCSTGALEVSRKVMGPETKEKKHNHKVATEFWIVIQGSVNIIIDDHPLELKTGEYLLVNPGTPTEILWAKKGTVVIVAKAPSITTDKYPC